eukprot:symbB.v1.2.005572.t1/scaffold296.1/size257539/14
MEKDLLKLQSKKQLNCNWLVASFSTVESFDIDAVAGSSAGRCQQFSGGFDDGTYGYLIPNQYGEICRFQLSNFGAFGEKRGGSGRSTGYLNLQSTDGDLQGMRPGFQAKGYGYLAPHTSSSSTSLGKMVRFNLASFSSVSVVDLTTVSSDLKRFSSAITDDTYGYLIPDENGKVVRFDLDPFALSDTKDITFWSSSANGFSDGSYLYLYSSSVSDVLRMDWENNHNELITLASGGYGVSMSVYAAFAAQSSLFFFNSFNYQVAYRLCQEVPGTSTTTSSSSSTSSTSTSSSSTSSTSTSTPHQAQPQLMAHQALQQAPPPRQAQPHLQALQALPPHQAQPHLQALQAPPPHQAQPQLMAHQALQQAPPPRQAQRHLPANQSPQPASPPRPAQPHLQALQRTLPPHQAQPHLQALQKALALQLGLLPQLLRQQQVLPQPRVAISPLPQQ